MCDCLKDLLVWKSFRLALTLQIFLLAILFQIADKITVNFTTTLCEQPILSYFAIPFWILGGCLLSYKNSAKSTEEKGEKQENIK